MLTNTVRQDQLEKTEFKTNNGLFHFISTQGVDVNNHAMKRIIEHYKKAIMQAGLFENEIGPVVLHILNSSIRGYVLNNYPNYQSLQVNSSTIILCFSFKAKWKRSFAPDIISPEPVDEF